MILLVNGATRTVRRLACPHLGHLLSPRAGNRIEVLLKTGLPWAADNGAFTGFDASAFSRMVNRIAGNPRCLFVACPDVVANARATLRNFDQWQPSLTELDLPVALVGQDGLEERKVPWDRMDAFFLGGSTKWKLSRAAATLAREARRRRKWLHMGRVNSLQRARYAFKLGCNSIDGSKYSRFPDTHIPRCLRLLHQLGA